MSITPVDTYHMPFHSNMISSSGPHKAISAVAALSHLEDGWYFGGGVAIDRGVLLSAAAILLSLADAGADEFEAFPDPAGEALVIAYGGDYSIEVMCHRQYIFDMSVESKGVLEWQHKGLNRTELQDRIENNKWQIRKLYDYYTQSTIAQKRGDTLGSLLGIPQEGVYQSFYSIAPLSRRTEYVTTSGSFMLPPSQVIRQSSGASGSIHSIQVRG